MTIAFVNNAKYGNNTGTSGTSFTIPSTTAGNLLVLVAGTKDAVDYVTSITGAGTWVQANDTGGSEGSSQQTEIWYCPNISGGVTSLSFTLNGNSRCVFWVGEFSGAATASVQDTGGSAKSAAVGTGVTPAPGSFTPSQANGLAIMATQFANTSTTISNRPTGFTAPSLGNVESAAGSGSGTEIDVVYKIDPGTSAIVEDWTISGSVNWGAVTAVLKEAGGGSTPASASGSITLGGTVAGAGAATASGSLTLGGTAAAAGAATASGSLTLGGTATGAVPQPPWPGLTAWNTAEGGSDDTAVTTGNSGGLSGNAWNVVGTAGGSPTFEATNALEGSLCYRTAPSAGATTLIWQSATLGTLTQSWGALFVRFDALAASSMVLLLAQQTDGGAIAFKLAVTSTGYIRIIRAANTTVATAASGTVISAGNWYRIEWHIDHTTDEYWVAAYDAGGAAALQELSGDDTAGGGFGTQSQHYTFGRSQTPDYTAQWDAFGIDTSGPLGPPAWLPTAATATGSLSLGGTAGGGGAATAAGSLTLGGSAAGVGQATASGALSLSGTASAAGVASAAGALTLGGTAVGTASTGASGSLTLGGTATGAAAAAATGSLSLAGTATGDIAGIGASGSLTLGGTASAQAVATASGALTLDGSASAGAAVPGVLGSLTLSGTATAAGQATAAGALELGGSATAGLLLSVEGSITLSGTADAGASAAASGSLTLEGTAAAGADAAAVGSLSLSGTATGFSGDVGAAGSLSLSGTAQAGAAGSASGALTLGGSALASSVGAAAAGSLTLGGSAQATALPTAAGSLSLAGTATGTVPGNVQGSLTLSGTVTGASGAGEASGILTLGGSAAASASPLAVGSLTLGAVAVGVAAASATGSLSLSGSAVPWWEIAATAQGSLSLSGQAWARPTILRPPDLEAMLTALLAPIGAVKVWMVDSRPMYHRSVEATTVEVAVRAASKASARSRAYAARAAMLGLTAGTWDDGVVEDVADFDGPAWSPDDDGAPRYVFRSTVTYRGTR